MSAIQLGPETISKNHINKYDQLKYTWKAKEVQQSDDNQNVVKEYLNTKCYNTILYLYIEILQLEKRSVKE